MRGPSLGWYTIPRTSIPSLTLHSPNHTHCGDVKLRTHHHVSTGLAHLFTSCPSHTCPHTPRTSSFVM